LISLLNSSTVESSSFSLLIFEYLFGILGMVIATPVVAILKILYNFFDEKYDFFGFLDSEKKE